MGGVDLLAGLGRVQPITGWSSDRFGRKKMFLVMLTVFTGASVACAASPNLGFLVFFRAVQGLGGGALMPLGMAIAMDLFPRERHGFVLATWGHGGPGRPRPRADDRRLVSHLRELALAIPHQRPDRRGGHHRRDLAHT